MRNAVEALEKLAMLERRIESATRVNYFRQPIGGDRAAVAPTLNYSGREAERAAHSGQAAAQTGDEVLSLCHTRKPIRATRRASTYNSYEESVPATAMLNLRKSSVMGSNGATGAGMRLREMLRRAGLSFDRFARESGFARASSVQRYLEWERGFLPFDKVERFARTLVGRGEPPITREEVYALSGVNPVPLPSQRTAKTPPRGEIEIAPNVDNIGYIEADLPLLGRPMGGGSDTYVFGREDNDMLALTARPIVLRNVPEAYAIYAYGDAMVPRYRPGEMLYIDPIRPIVPGDDVVIRMRDGTGFVREFVRRTLVTVVCRQHNPPTEIEYPATDVESLHLIIGATRIRA